MKTVFCLFVLVFVVTQGDALRCLCGGLNFCPGGPVETCSKFSDVCGRVVITSGASPNFFKGCMEDFECAGLNGPGISAVCCKKDLCNR